MSSGKIIFWFFKFMQYLHYSPGNYYWEVRA